MTGALHGAVSGETICRMPGSCASCSLRPLALCGSGDEVGLDLIEALRQPCRKVAARRVLFHEGERLPQVYQLFDGWAFRYKVMKDGRRQILSFLLPGDSINMSAIFVDRISYSVKTLTQVSLCVFDAGDLFNFIQSHPTVTRRAGIHCANANAAAEELILDLGRRTAFDRVRHLIAGLVKRLQARGFDSLTYPLPLTQLHIADATGLTPVHVGRILGEMRHAKLLDLKRGWLTLHDLDWLQGSSR